MTLVSFLRGRAVPLLLAVLPFLMIACGDGDSADGGNGGSGGDRTTITFWHFQSEPGQKKALMERIAAFEKEHPDIAVELQELTYDQGKGKLQAAFSSGLAPDVVELGSDWVAQFSAAGVLADQKGMAEDSIGRFADYVTAPGRWKGGIYAWPWVIDTRALFVNTQLLTEAGVDTVAVDSLWSDLAQKAEQVNRKAPEVYGYATNGSDKHRLYKKVVPFFWSNGGEVLDSAGRPQLNSPQNVEALESYLALAGAGFMDSQQGLDQLFIRGKVAYWISGPWLVERIAKENPSLRYQVRSLPGFAGRRAISFAGGEYLAISEQSEQKGAAKKLITFLTSPEQALAFAKALPGGTTPADMSVSTDPFLQSGQRRSFTRQLASARMTPIHPQWLEIEAIVEEEVAAALLGQKSAREALDAAQARAVDLVGQGA